MALSGLVGAIGGGGTVGRAVVEVVGDSAKLRGDLDKAKATTASATTQMGAKTSKFSGLAVGAYAAVGTAIIGFVGTTINAAASLGEQTNRVRVIFGEASEAVLKFGEDAAHSAGLSKAAAYEGAASFGALFDSAGLAAKAGADMSIALVQLAGDMGSFNDQDPSEMLDRLRAGLSGEAEPLRRFGVFIDEARVKSEAYASGIAKVGEELTVQQKIQARYNIIMQDTIKQQGDFARTLEGSLPNQLREMTAKFTNLAAEIGGVVLPVVVNITKVLVDLLPVIKPVTVALIALAGAFILVKGAAAVAGLLVTVGAALQGFSILVGLGAIVGNFGIALSSLASGPLALVAASLVSLYLVATNVGSAFKGISESSAFQEKFGEGARKAAAGTEELTAKTRELANVNGQAADAARELLAAELALVGGFVGIAAAVDSAADAERTLAEARKELTKLTKEGKQGTEEYADAQEAVDDAARGSLQSQVSLAGAVQKYAEEVSKGDISQKEAVARVRDFGVKAGLSATEIQGLVSQVKSAIREYKNIPTGITTNVTLNNSAAIQRLRELQDKYRAIKNEIEGTIVIGTRPGPVGGGGKPGGNKPGGGGQGLPGVTGALGGIIAGASGFITRGPTMLVGESRKMTFAGRGAEAVIPFDNRGIGILAKALEKAGGQTASVDAGNYLAIHFNAPIYGMRDFKQQVVRALEEASSRFGLV